MNINRLLSIAIAILIIIGYLTSYPMVVKIILLILAVCLLLGVLIEARRTYHDRKR